MFPLLLSEQVVESNSGIVGNLRRHGVYTKSLQWGRLDFTHRIEHVIRIDLIYNIYGNKNIMVTTTTQQKHNAIPP